MIEIAIWTIIGLVALQGWGHWLLHSCRSSHVSGTCHRLQGVWLCVLLGHIPVLALGLFLHGFTGLAPWPGYLVGGMGVGLSMGSRAGRLRWKQSFAQKGWLVMLLLAGFVALFASRPTAHGDSGLYHLQAVAWMAEGPLPRGLANLHTCFGYNSSWWILAALMSPGQDIALGSVLVSLPLLVAVGGLLVNSSLRIVRGKGDFADWFLLPAWYFWLRQVCGVNTPAPATDIPANLFILLTFWSLIWTAPGRMKDGSSIPTPFSASWLLPLSFACLAATIKASALILVVLLAAAWSLWFLLRWKQSAIRFKIELPSLGIIALLALLMLAWMGHGVLISGYPAWPSRLGGDFFDVPWKVPGEVLEANYLRARNWAFTYGADAQAVATESPWKLWLYGQSALTNLLIAGTVSGALLLAFLILLKQRRLQWHTCQVLLLPAAIALVGLVWNLANVPALRFASGYAFGLLGCGAALIGTALPVRWARVAVTLWIPLCLLALSKQILARPFHLVSVAPLPVVEMKPRYTKQGETIWIPADDFAWLGRRPSTPSFEFNPSLWIVRDGRSGKIIEIRRSQPSSGEVR